MGFEDLVDSFWGGLWGMLWDLFSPFLTIFLSICLLFFSGRLAIEMIKKSLYVSWYNKSFFTVTEEKAKLADSLLLMACLQKIKDGELESVYINSNMACFNFSGEDIYETSVLDFQKMGYEPIDGRSIAQYLGQLEMAAKKIPSVKSVERRPCKFNSKAYLIFQGNYGDVPGTKEVYLSFNYRVNQNLKSFQIK